MKRFATLCALVFAAACGDTATLPDVATDDLLVTSSAVGRGNSSNAKACQKNGWQSLVRGDGTSFASEEDCTSYAAEGGALYRTQTITFDALTDKTFGDADFDVSATASSGLTVTYSASGDCTVTGSTVHLTGAGSCTITAHQAGDATWYAAPDVSQSFAIAKGNQTLAFTSTNPSPAPVGGPTYTPTATATSGLTVAFALDAASTGCSLTSGVVSFTSVGTCVINADQAGDANWNAAPQQQQSITVIPEEPKGEVIHAVAYIDEDPNDGGYNPGVDRLIAKLIDGEDAAADGLIGPGDLIVTDKYPVAFDLSTVGSFAVNQHTVAGISAFTSAQIIVTRADGVAFQWAKNGSQEQYGEGSNLGAISFWQDIVANQDADELIQIGSSPSLPGTGVGTVILQHSVADDRFVDVEIRTVPN